MLPLGGPVDGEDFVDRENEIEIIISSLEKGNILLAAPRGYGKTSIMKRIETILSEDRIPVFFIDVNGINSPEEFLMELAIKAFDMAEDKKSFIERLKKFFFGKLEDIEVEIFLGVLRIKLKKRLMEEIKKGGWKEEGRTIFTFIKEYFGNTTYFIIDEFSECIHEMEKKDKKETELFLKWFKSLRTKEDSVKFVICGSTSIERAVGNVAPLSTIMDLKRVPINGFDKETALHIVKKIFEEEEVVFTDRIREKVIECIGVPSIPYFLSVFLSIIIDECTGKNLDEETVEEIYENRFMGTKGKPYFAYYIQRLKIYYDDKEERAAKAILKELCQAGEISKGFAFEIFKNMTSKDDYEWFTDLIYDLSNDSYLEMTEGKITFYSKPLADWWRSHYA